MILARFKWKIVLVYLDDVIVYSRTKEEHFENLDTVLGLMHEAGITLKLHKFQFFKDNVDYFGHVVSREKLAVAIRAKQAVKEYLPSETSRSSGPFFVYGMSTKGLSTTFLDLQPHSTKS